MMYFDYEKLNPCKQCGMKRERIEQRNCGPILELKCPCCSGGVSGASWEECIERWNSMNRPWRQIEVMKDSVFHVHTKRCKHAGDEEDEAYVRRAKELGAKRIVFTDHAPFPGNPFNGRMDMDDLPEYISSLKHLNDKIKGITVQIGLEIEYLPSFRDYYEELAENPDIEWLVLGQHFYEYQKGVYSFADSSEVKNQWEYIGICEALIEGMNTGLFRVVAHPDRAFKRRKKWDEQAEEQARKLINTAIQTGTILEQNYSSARRKNQYRPEFWELLRKITEENPANRIFTIKGSDAHSTDEILYGFHAFEVITAEGKKNPLLNEVICDMISLIQKEGSGDIFV